MFAFGKAITLVLTPFYLGKAIDFMIGKDNVDMVGVVEMLKIARCSMPLTLY
ncbi:hypothetical protein MGH68_03085 [Erysipelothrix sp. D19-032]